MIRYSPLVGMVSFNYTPQCDSSRPRAKKRQRNGAAHTCPVTEIQNQTGQLSRDRAQKRHFWSGSCKHRRLVHGSGRLISWATVKSQRLGN